MRKTPFAFLLLVGCDPHPHDETARKAEEPKTVQVTVWSDRFEIFLEHRPIVVAHPTVFVTHVTDLKTSRARSEGKVAFLLSPGTGPALEYTEEAPKRPGIYAPELRFPSAGSWKVALRIPAGGAESVIELPAVTAYATPEEAKQAPEQEAPEGISFLKEQQWKLQTRIEAVGKRPMVQRLKLPAVVSAPPGFRAVVTPPLGGRFLAPAGKPCPPLGGRVEAGELLALIQPPASDLAAKLVEAEADVAKTKLALEQAELANARVKKLAAGQAKTERELQESEFALQAAKASHHATLALKSAYEKSGAAIRADAGNLPVFELRSPIKGTLIHVGATLGEHVGIDRSLFTILNSETVHLEARVSESDVARIGDSRNAVYETPDRKGQFLPILGEGGGRVVLFGPEVDATARTVPLIYEVRNPEGRLRIGMALTLYLETGRAEEALALPDSALVDEDGRFVAFVQVSGESFQKRDSLVLGIRDSGFTQVLEGLPPGERVVTRGAYAVRLASLSTSLPAHGHAH